MGLLPLAVPWLPWRRIGRRAAWLLPWGSLAVCSLVTAPALRDPGGGIETALIQGSWCCAMALGLALRASGVAGSAVAPWALAAAAAAAVPGVVRDGGTFGNPGLLAAFLAAALVAGAGAWLAPLVQGWRQSPRPSGSPPGGPSADAPPSAGFLTRRTARRAWAVVAAAVALAAMVRCGSVAAWVALACGVAAWLLAGVLGSVRRRSAALGGVAILGVVALGLALRVLPADRHATGRLHLARASLATAVSALPWGAGAGQFHGAFLDAQALVLERRPQDLHLWTNADHAHSEPLHTLAEQGPPGALLLLLPVAAALLRPRSRSAWATVVTCAALGLAGPLLVQPASATVAALAVGLALGEAGSSGAAGPRWPGPSRARRVGQAIAVVVALAVALAALATASAALVSDRLLARGARGSSDPLLAASAAVALRPARPLAHRAELLMGSDAEAARQLAVRSVLLDPSPAGWLLAGNAAMRAGAVELAIPCFTEAARLNPRLFAAHFDLALAYEQAGDLASARRHARRARSLRPDDPRLVILPR